VPGFIPWSKVDLPLRALRSIWLATTRPDGRPHAMPLWFWWDGRDVYFTTRDDTQKARNLAVQSWAIAHAGDGDDVIILEGSVEKVGDRVDQERVDAAYRAKYVDPHSGAQATIFNERDALYRLRVRHVMTWEYGVIGTRTDWRFDDDD
jgi:hypothetical protein